MSKNNKNKNKTQYPIADAGHYICSDGMEYANASWANEHENSLKLKTKTQ